VAELLLRDWNAKDVNHVGCRRRRSLHPVFVCYRFSLRQFPYRRMKKLAIAYW
jgi:hypothetical protein